MTREWKCDHLNVGDEVIVRTGAMTSLRKVIRRTATRQIVLDDGTRFTAEGRKIGDRDAWDKTWLREACPDLRALAETQLLIREVEERLARWGGWQGWAFLSIKALKKSLDAILARMESRHETLSDAGD